MKYKYLYTIVLFIASASLFAQARKVAEAEKEYEKLAYVDAIKTYERIVENGYKSKEVLQHLADSYYFIADLESAAKWYGVLFAFAKEVPPEYYYRYAQSLKAVKNYTKADETMAVFIQKAEGDTRAKLAKEGKNYREQIEHNSGRYAMEPTVINSEFSDYGSAFFENKVVFASARLASGFIKRKHTMTGENFTNLYSAEMDENGTLSNPQRFGADLNSKFHESTPVFTKDGKTVYFTRNNYYRGKKGKDESKTTLLKLYKATFNGEKWSNVVELEFNSDQYSSAHPALSPDDATLYFASDMLGTIGQSDLFKVEIKADGTYGTPLNLGTKINTEGRETFPMITPDGELYFASDGHPGLGGLDIFVSEIGADGAFSKTQNVGKPVNSSKDDFGFLINSTTKIGYVTSNREGGQGGDDIYKFIETRKLECQQVVDGTVVDKETSVPISFAKVTLSNELFFKLKEFTADKDGKFDFGKVACDSKFYIKVEKEAYNTIEIGVITTNESGITSVELSLEKTVKVIKQGADLFKSLNLSLIYFDLDNSFISEDASVELAKILDVLQQNPTMKIDVRSHTDCRQTAKYNIALSERRAKATVAWLVGKGVEKSRLTGKGYGESQLINDCGCEPTNTSDCSESQHQANRRSEFIVVKN
jgi:outer membrane protein OmpA-like peptidoglycan-associated protein/tetratricopeptide (TPR) repeat protein